jgi:hypothetical protein
MSKKGRPRMRWLEDAAEVLRKMKVKRRRRQKAVDREEWESVLKEAKAVRGICIQGVSK